MPEPSITNVGWRALEQLLLPSKRKPCASVLIFHQVLQSKDPLRPNEPDEREFEDLIGFLSRRFHVVSLLDAVRAVQSGAGDSHVVAITFDDGYANNLEVAMPILEHHRVPATFFVTTAPLETGIMWNDRVLNAVRSTREDELDAGCAGLGRLPTGNTAEKRKAQQSLIRGLKYLEFERRDELVAEIESNAGVSTAPRLMMTRDQVRALAANRFADIGGHTVSHPILARLPSEDARREIVAGKSALEEIIGKKISCFAFPNGVPNQDFNEEHVAFVRTAGYECAVSTSVGSFRQGWDPYQIPRVKPWDKTPWRLGLRMLMAARNDGTLADTTVPRNA